MNLSALQSTSLPDMYKNVEIVDMRGEIKTNPKYTWKTYGTKKRPTGVRSMDDVITIVLHHDAISKASVAKYGDKELINRIATSHINSTKNVPTGDPGFPYHFYIRNGTVFACNDIEDYLFGVSNNNGYTVHCSVSGEYSKSDKLTDQDLNALITAVLIARANMPKFKNVLAHSEIDSTKCPGYDFTHVRGVLATLYPLADKPPIDSEVSAKVEAVKARINDLYKTSTTAGKYAPIAQQYLTNIYEVMKKEGIL